MGKETKTAGKTATETTATVVTAENVLDVRKSQNLADISLGEQVDEEIKKEQDDRKKREIKSRYLKAQYKVDSALVDQRHSKRMLEISKYKIGQIGRVARWLKGFPLTEEIITHAKVEDDIFKRETVDEKAKTLTIVTDSKSGEKKTYKVGDKVPAFITYVEYDEMLGKIHDAVRKKQTEEENIRTKETAEIDAAYGNYWDRSWRY